VTYETALKQILISAGRMRRCLKTLKKLECIYEHVLLFCKALTVVYHILRLLVL